MSEGPSIAPHKKTGEGENAQIAVRSNPEACCYQQLRALAFREGGGTKLCRAFNLKREGEPVAPPLHSGALKTKDRKQM